MSDKSIQLKTIDGTSYLFPKTKAELIDNLATYSFKTEWVKTENYSAIYRMTVTDNTGTKYIGDAINVPYQWKLKNADIKMCNNENVPVSGYMPGDIYIQYNIQKNVNDVESDYVHIYTKLGRCGAGIKYNSETQELSLNTTDSSVKFTNLNKNEFGLIPGTKDITDEDQRTLTGSGKWVLGITYEGIE